MAWIWLVGLVWLGKLVRIQKTLEVLAIGKDGKGEKYRFLLDETNPLKFVRFERLFCCGLTVGYLVKKSGDLSELRSSTSI